MLVPDFSTKLAICMVNELNKITNSYLISDELVTLVINYNGDAKSLLGKINKFVNILPPFEKLDTMIKVVDTYLNHRKIHLRIKNTRPTAGWYF